jgi:hypothetical protein
MQLEPIGKLTSAAGLLLQHAFRSHFEPHRFAGRPPWVLTRPSGSAERNAEIMLKQLVVHLPSLPIGNVLGRALYFLDIPITGSCGATWHCLSGFQILSAGAWHAGYFKIRDQPCRFVPVG